MPVQAPRALARFNKRVNNPIQGQYAWLLPPWAVIVHKGRKSGRVFRTPVDAFRKGDTLAVVVLYGEHSDWVRNLLAAGEGQVVRGGKTYPFTDVELVEVDDAGDRVSGVARRFGRMSGKLLVGTLGPAEAGFGRGPRRTA
jgi:deazaflavin-dependent oxidoreductase (nitroreductase family)